MGNIPQHRYRIEHPAGPFDVTFSEGPRVVVLTPSSWGTYPELQYSSRGRPVGALYAYLALDSATGAWSLDTGQNTSGLYVNRADSKNATARQLIDALTLARDVVRLALEEHPDAIANADALAIANKRAALLTELSQLDSRRSAIRAELRELPAAPASAELPRIPVPTGAPCVTEVTFGGAQCGAPATRMVAYTGRPGAGVTDPPAEPTCDDHAATILRRFPHCYQDVTGTRQDAPDATGDRY